MNSPDSTIHTDFSFFNVFKDRKIVIVFFFILALCAGVRIWFWQSTHLVLEDSLITFRYAENLAQGNGFVYNADERVLGTTTPLWTLILAGVKWIGADLFSAATLLNIIFDCTTCFLMVLLLFSFNKQIAFFFGILFSLSSVIVPVAISGMESSLLVLAMTVAFVGFARKNIFFGIGLAMTLLTRIDGAIFISVLLGASFMSDKKWTMHQLVLMALLCFPWFIFSYFYFGNVLPQSLLAKSAVYQTEVSLSAGPFINYFTPFLSENTAAIIIKSILLALLLIGIALQIKSKSSLLPLTIFAAVYTILFMFSRTVIFLWYLVPPVFVSHIVLACAFSWLLTVIQKKITQKYFRSALISFVIGFPLVVNLFLVRERLLRYAEFQEFEKDLKQKIGLWFRYNAQPGSKIFLEPIGYIGYFSGLEMKIYDEVGIVAPLVAQKRSKENDWYTESIKALQPEYIVQYADLLSVNKAEGSNLPLFYTQTAREWFFSQYSIFHTMKTTRPFLILPQHEQQFVIFKKKDVMF